MKLGFARVPGSIDGLDGLRALAIGLVLARHGVHIADEQLPAASIAGWSAWTPLRNGWIGVDLFFLLSGFLIGGHLIRRHGTDRVPSLKRYLGARALRILPTYYTVLFLTLIGIFPAYAVAQEGLPWRIVYHLLFLQDYLPSDINVAFWSLGVEEKFYLVAPFLVAAALRLQGTSRGVAWAVVLLLPSVLRFATVWLGGEPTSYAEHFIRLRSPFHVTFDGLVLGVLIAQLYHHLPTREWLAGYASWLWWGGATVVLLHLVPFDLMRSLTTYDFIAQPLVLSCGFGALLLAVALQDSKQGVLASYPMLVGARLSYTLYLVHLPLIPMSIGLATLSGLTGWAWAAAYGTAYLLLSTGLAMLIHFGVEQPFLTLKSRL